MHTLLLMQRVCLLRFSTKIAEHRLLFIAQPRVISWFFRFPSILIRFFLINTLFFCIIFLWFTLASIWSEKAFWCSNTFSMWHVKDCQVRSPRLVEHEMYVFSRAWLKCDFRMNFKRAITVIACNFCTEINLFVCASFRVSSLNFEGDKLSPWLFF